MVTLLRRSVACHCRDKEEMPDDDIDVKPFIKFLAHHLGINAYLDFRILTGQGGVPIPPILGVPVGPGWTTSFAWEHTANLGATFYCGIF